MWRLRFGAKTSARGSVFENTTTLALTLLRLTGYVFRVVGTSRCDVRAACSGATPSNASRMFPGKYAVVCLGVLALAVAGGGCAGSIKKLPVYPGVAEIPPEAPGYSDTLQIRYLGVGGFLLITSLGDFSLRTQQGRAAAP